MGGQCGRGLGLPAPPSGRRFALVVTVRNAILIIHIAVAAIPAGILVFRATGEAVTQTVLCEPQTRKRGRQCNAGKHFAECRKKSRGATGQAMAPLGAGFWEMRPAPHKP